MCLLKVVASFAKLQSPRWCARCFRGLELSYEGVQAKGSTLFIKSVTAKGSVPSAAGKVGGSTDTAISHFA